LTHFIIVVKQLVSSQSMTIDDIDSSSYLGWWDVQTKIILKHQLPQVSVAKILWWEVQEHKTNKKLISILVLIT